MSKAAAKISFAAFCTLLLVLGFYLSKMNSSWKYVHAAQTGNTVELNKYLDAGVDPNVRVYPGGVSALRTAIENRQEATVRLLLERGADPNDGLYLAVEMGQVGTAKLLLTKGANIKPKNSGESLLDIAKNRGDKKMIQLLKSRGG